MNKPGKILVLAVLLCFAFSSVAFAAVPNNIIIMGDKAYDINLLNNANYAAQINQAFVAAGNTFIYKTPAGAYVGPNLEQKSDSDVGAFTLTKADGTTEEYDEDGNVVEPVTELKVVSVSAINAKQIEIKFNKEVDMTTAEDESKYYLDNVARTNVTATATLQDDKKTVILTVNSSPSAFVNGEAYSVKVKGVKDTAGNEVKEFVTSFIANDTTAPTISSITAKANASGTTTVTVKFNEPLNVLGSFKIDDVGVTASAGATANEVVLTTSTPLAPGSSHTLTVLATSDFANNAISPINTTFTVEADLNAPTVQSISAKDENTVQVVFNKEIASTVATDATITIDKVGVAAGTLIASNIRLDSVDKKVVLFDVPAAAYATGESSTNLVIGVKGIKDKSGNEMAEVKNQNVTLTKDATKPTLTKSEVKSDNQSLYFTFNEDVKAVGTLNASGIRIVKDDGVDVTSSLGGGISAVRILEADKTVGDNIGPVLEVAFTSPMAAGTYTITIPANKVQDDSLTGNKYDQVITYTFTVGTPADTTAPVPSFGSKGANGFTITWNTAVKGGAVAGSATDVNNYQLDGKPLPAGTVITLDDNKRTATFTFPAGTFTMDYTASNPLNLTISGVQNASGVVMDPITLTNVEADDNTAPTLVSAEALNATTLKLTFDENILAANDADGSGDEITIDDGTHTPVTIDLGSASVNILNKVVTITTSGLDTIDLSSAEITAIAGSFTDKSLGANDSAEIIGTVADKFAQAATTVAISDLDDASGTASSIGLQVVPTNATVDKAVKYYVYIIDGATSAITTVDGLEDAGYTPVLTISQANISQYATAKALPATITKLSDDTDLATHFDGTNTVDVYVVTEDASGNKALAADTDVTTFDITD